MKNILKLLILLAIPLGLANAQNLEKKISVSYAGIPLETVLRELSHQHNLKFSYSKDLVQVGKEITCFIKDGSIREILENIFGQADIQYQMMGDQIVLKKRIDAGSRLVLKGKVVDQTTRHPMPFASVRLDGTNTGTISNDEGGFMLHIPEAYRTGAITVSFVGYKPSHLPVSGSQQVMTIALQEDATALNTVVITGRTGLSIMEEAISRIKQNYDTNAMTYTYFVRDRTLQNDEPIAAGEAVYQAYRAALSATPANQVKVLRGRRVKDFGAIQKILQSFARWTGFEIGLDNKMIFFADLSAQRRDDEFPGTPFLKQHQFELLGTSLLDDREVYVIAFDQKERYRNKSLYTGKFYIDTETLAFIRIETALSPRGIDRAKFFGSSRAIALLFGYSKCSILEDRAIVNYRPVNGKWYVSSAQIFWGASLVKPKYELASQISLRGELVVTDIETNRVESFRSADVLTHKDERDWAYQYAPGFWDGFNTIPEDEDMEEAFNEIRNKNRKSGIDMNFWKRYQPYKSNPSWLLQDSAHMQAGQQTVLDSDSMGSVLAGDSLNKILKPKYPPLSRTFSTDHFVFYYSPDDSSNVQELINVLENNYVRVLHDFQLEGLSGPVHVEVYPDIESYHFAIGKPGSAESDAGMAVDNFLFKMVSPGNPGSYHTHDSMLKAAVHEFSHCVHYNFIEQLKEEEQRSISEGNESPWLFEAIACFEAGQFYDPGRFEYLARGLYPTLKDLNDVDLNGKIYDIGFILIEFIQSTWGKPGLVSLLKQNGNIQATFAISESEFEARFYTYIRKIYLKPH